MDWQLPPKEPSAPVQKHDSADPSDYEHRHGMSFGQVPYLTKNDVIYAVRHCGGSAGKVSGGIATCAAFLVEFWPNRHYALVSIKDNRVASVNDLVDSVEDSVAEADGVGDDD